MNTNEVTDRVGVNGKGVLGDVSIGLEEIRVDEGNLQVKCAKANGEIVGSEERTRLGVEVWDELHEGCL